MAQAALMKLTLSLEYHGCSRSNQIRALEDSSSGVMPHEPLRQASSTLHH